MRNYLLLMLLVAAASASSAPWQFAGPGGSTGMMTGNMTVSSAAHVALKTPQGFLLGTVNGGVWLTRDSVTNSTPHWTNVFDGSGIPCSSLAVLSPSPTDPSRVYAGCGSSTSGQMGYSWRVRSEGEWSGIAFSSDGGVTWQMLPGFPAGHSVSGIVELPNGSLAVSSRGPFTGDQNDGGIFVAPSYQTIMKDSGSWSRSLRGVAVSSMIYDSVLDKLFASTVATETAANLVMVSSDGGATWTNVTACASLLLSGAPLFVPFYSALAVTPGKSLFVLVLLSPMSWLTQGGLGGGNGQVLYLNLSDPQASWRVVGGQPATANPQNAALDCVYDCKTLDKCCWTLDQDYSGKDYGALLVDPRNDSVLYVAGNGMFLAYRVDWRRALDQGICTYVNDQSTSFMTACRNTSVDLYLWTPMYNQAQGFRNDTIDDQLPHVDCRNFAWDPETASLLLLSDGGVFVRRFPESPTTGYWRGWAGDIGTFEYVSVSYDAYSDRFIAGAQDNDCQISVRGAVRGNENNNHRPTFSFNLGCDGTTTAVVAATNSSPVGRYYCSCYQMMTLSFVELDATTDPVTPLNITTIHIANRGFPGRASANVQVQYGVTPFFETTYRLNTARSTSLHFWANVSVYGSSEGPGIFALDVSSSSGLGPNATLVMPTDEDVLDLHAGGMLNGTLSPEVVVAVSRQSLFTQVSLTQFRKKRPFPDGYSFAEPINFKYNSDLQSFCENPQAQALSPCTPSQLNTWPNHRSSVYLAVDAGDAAHIAVTGWPNLNDNTGEEKIFVTTDAGDTWCDVFGSLLVDTGSQMGVARPAGLAFVTANYLVVGTLSGVYATMLSASCGGTIPPPRASWVRLGDANQFPRVAISRVTYDAPSDTLVIATLGRGAYVMEHAAASVAQAVTGSSPSNDNGKTTVIAVSASVAGIVVLLLVAAAFRKFQRQRSSEDGTLLAGSSLE